MDSNWKSIQDRYATDPDFKAEVDAVMNVDSIEEIPLEETTMCSTMHCYNRAKETHDPAHPPFCEQCQDAKKGKTV